MRSLVWSAGIASWLLLGMAPAMAQDFPRTSYAGAPNGDATAFVGSWQMSYPQGPDIIVSETLIGCDAPMVIELVDANHISYRTPATEAPIVAEVFEFEGRTTWMPDAYDTSIIVWLTPDSFHLIRTELGKAVWDDPRLLVRCGTK